MAVYQTQGIILARTDIREFDRQYTVLTETLGKRTILAKGTKRITSKLAGSLEPPRIADLWVAEGKQIDRVTGCISLESFRATRQHAKNMLRLQLFGEAMDALSRESETDGALYALARSFFAYVESASARNETVPMTIVDIGLWRLLSVVGWKPDVTRCIRCHAPLRDDGPLVFATAYGGPVCDRHADTGHTLSLSVPTRALLTELFHEKPAKKHILTRHEGAILHAATIAALEHVSEKPLQTDTVLARMQQKRDSVAKQKPSMVS